MPVLSKFYGIVIRMLFVRAFTAHFYAFYDKWELMIGLSPIRILQGEAPDRVRSLVLEWAGRHQSELMDAWTRLAQAQHPKSIDPLV